MQPCDERYLGAAKGLYGLYANNGANRLPADLRTFRFVAVLNGKDVAEACERSTSERLRALARASTQEISIHQARTVFLLVFRNNPEIAATV